MYFPNYIISIYFPNYNFNFPFDAKLVRPFIWPDMLPSDQWEVHDESPDRASDRPPSHFSTKLAVQLGPRPPEDWLDGRLVPRVDPPRDRLADAN